jgi:hypothetical protein
MLETSVYNALTKGELPKIPNRKSWIELFGERISTRRRRITNTLNKTSFFRPLSRIKPVSVVDVKLEGYRLYEKNAYIVMFGDSLTFNAVFRNNLPRPILSEVSVSIDDVSNVVVVLFMRNATYSVSVSKPIYEPTNIKCVAKSRPPARGIRYYDQVTQIYPVGVLDDRYKPLTEFPTPNVSNVELDIAYGWEVKNTIYPLPLPEGLTFDNLSVEFISGFISYEGKLYKDPTTNNIVRIRARIVNNTGGTITVKHWGLPISVLYEDNRHVSQADIDISFPTLTIANGTSREYTLDISLPTWAYGKVAIAHALNIYKDGMYIYGGGPFYCFEVFRLRLP